MEENWSGQICKELDLPTSIKHVQQIMHKTTTLRYKKIKKAPTLTMEHKKRCMDSAPAFDCQTDYGWSKLIFSGEKN